MLPASRQVERELSWLSFNERVLDLAADPSTPLLERVRFSAIFSSNLDEFYMVRVASVLSNLEDGTPMTSTPDVEPSVMMQEISRRTHELVARQYHILKSELLPELRKAGIEIVEWQELDSEERKFVSKIFTERIFPVLTPLAVILPTRFPTSQGSH
jgi:polyphosphate kinase